MMKKMVSFRKLDGTKFDIDPDVVHVINEVKSKSRDKAHTVLHYGSSPEGKPWAGVVALDHPIDEVRVYLKGLGCG